MTLSGPAGSIFVFQKPNSAGQAEFIHDFQMTLQGGVRPCDIYFVATTEIVLFGGVKLYGNFLSPKIVSIGGAASSSLSYAPSPVVINGRVLASGSVELFDAVVNNTGACPTNQVSAASNVFPNSNGLKYYQTFAIVASGNVVATPGTGVQVVGNVLQDVVGTVTGFPPATVTGVLLVAPFVDDYTLFNGVFNAIDLLYTNLQSQPCTKTFALGYTVNDVLVPGVYCWAGTAGAIQSAILIGTPTDTW